MTLKEYDNSFLCDNIKTIAGVDEVGRGPLAGPVVAAAVIFDRDVVIEGINDSKKLTEKKREKLYPEILEKCLAYGIGVVDEKEIDKINILQATFKAMRMSVDQLQQKPHLLLIDGNKTFPYPSKTKAIVKGDSKSFSIAAASILAKVTRDEMMKKAALEYPHYAWEKNKGYGTKEHIEGLFKYGPSPLHRVTFLTNILAKQEEINF